MLYNIYRESEFEGCILMFLLLLILRSLFGLQKGKSFVRYMLGGMLLYTALYYLTFLFVSEPFFIPGVFPRLHPYWYGFLCTTVSAMTMACLCLDGSFASKLVYTLFYISFVQLYKVVCGPLYSAEYTMDPLLYRRLDLATSVLLYLLLYLFYVLCRRVKLPDTGKIFARGFWITLYFPVALLLFYAIRFSGADFLQDYIEQYLAAIILIAMPLLYYLFASLLNSFADQRRIDQALSRANAQAGMYRLSAEMEERLRMERHELKNRYLYIHTLLRQKKYDQLDAYLEEKIGQRMDSLSMVSTGNPTIDYVLTQKIRQAQEAGIKIYSEILIPAALPVDDADFCTIFLNLIDNAIEASADEENPDIHISLKCVQNYLHCEISNKVRTEKITGNPQMQTTKQDVNQHGLGLRIVRETIRHSDGILQMGLEANYYRTVFMLPLCPLRDTDRA